MKDMGDFRKPHGFGGGKRPGGFRSGGRPPFGGGRGGFGGPRGRDGGRPHGQMHSARCSECGNTCEVPFRPTGERPVYCNDCFGGKKDMPMRRDMPTRPMEKPTSVAPKAPSAPVEDPRVADLAHQVSALHKKVDSLLEMMRKMTHAPAATETMPAAVPVATTASAVVASVAPSDSGKTSSKTKTSPKTAAKVKAILAKKDTKPAAKKVNSVKPVTKKKPAKK